MRILLFGKTGQIGSLLQRTLAPLGAVIAPGSTQADFRKPESLREVVRDAAPQLIVNAAAYTAVDDAEREREVAETVNGIAPGVLAEETARIGAALVHYSTDYVFDGSKLTAYEEDDATHPLNEYGKSKRQGEVAIERSGAAHLIFRTSWIYATTGKNFLLTMLRLAETQSDLRIVADQVGAPTSADVVAHATAAAIEATCGRELKRSPADGFASVRGTYHLTCTGSASWHSFAAEIMRQAVEQRMITRDPSVQAITTAEFPRPAQRPMNSVLSTRKFTRTFGIELPDWHIALRQVMTQIAEHRNRTG